MTATTKIRRERSARTNTAGSRTVSYPDEVSMEVAEDGKQMTDDVSMAHGKAGEDAKSNIGSAESGVSSNPDKCVYCGERSDTSIAAARCAVCGMAIARDHFPHIIRVEPDRGVFHFCSLVCMENFEYLDEGDE